MVEFVAVENLSSWGRNPGEAPLIALGRESAWALSQTRFADEEHAVEGIHPLGIVGELLWNRLPPELAVLVAPPWRNAIAVVRQDVLSAHPTTEDLWQAVAERVNSGKCPVLPAVEARWQEQDRPSLTPTLFTIPTWLAHRIASYSPGDVASRVDLSALHAGLLQVHDRLDESHSLSQSIEGKGRHRNGDYWHAIMHRREPDYGNSKYWFRRVGQHPVFLELAQLATLACENFDEAFVGEWPSRLITRTGWDPFAFVDLCQQAERTDGSILGELARQIQWIEMLLLIDRTYQDARGDSRSTSRFEWERR
ncbi:MAG: hypothetical protein KDA80_04775 [Planctomycetaceae bacterium]|nr:hypothetical protein [Planctomycetaceae bacterium]